MNALNRTRLPASTMTRSSRALLAAPLLAAAVGCATAASGVAAPSRHPEAPAPHLRATAEAQAEGEPIAAHAALPQPTASGNVSLAGMLAYADKHSPVLSVARSTRSRAQAARVAASVSQVSNPELTLAAGPRFAPAGTGLDAQVSLMQQVQLGGQRDRRLAAAERLRELTDAEIEHMRWLVHCDVHAEFHRSLVEQERVRLAERVVAFQNEVLKVVERQLAAGEAAPLTLRLAQAEVAQAQQVLVAAEQSFLASRFRLGQLSGWPAAIPPTPSGTLDTAREPPSAALLQGVAQAKLPSLRAGRVRVQEAEARVSVAEREGWMKPSVGAQYGREANPAGEGATHVVMGVLALPLPVFQTGQAALAEAHSDVLVAEAQLVATQRLLDGQIAEAHSEVSAAAQRTGAYGTEIIPRFEENLTLLRRSFELGEIDILALSTGRERFLRIQSDALTAHLDYFVALAGLERVVGVDLWHDDHHQETAP